MKGLGLWLLVTRKKADGVFELPRASVASPPELLVGQEGEPALDLIDPGTVARGEVQLESTMPQQPSMDPRRLVDAGVVEHKVNLQLLGYLAIDAFQEHFEVDGAVPSMGLADHFAARHSSDS